MCDRNPTSNPLPHALSEHLCAGHCRGYLVVGTPKEVMFQLKPLGGAFKTTPQHLCPKAFSSAQVKVDNTIFESAAFTKTQT